MNYAIELMFVAFCVIVPTAQGLWFNATKATGKTINHTLWGWAYVLYCVAICLVIQFNTLLIPAAILIRLVFFDVVLNVVRNKAVFYVNPNGKSLFDRLIKTEQRRFNLWAVATLMLGLLQILL